MSGLQLLFGAYYDEGGTVLVPSWGIAWALRERRDPPRPAYYQPFMFDGSSFHRDPIENKWLDYRDLATASTLCTLADGLSVEILDVADALHSLGRFLLDDETFTFSGLVAWARNPVTAGLLLGKWLRYGFLVTLDDDTECRFEKSSKIR